MAFRETHQIGDLLVDEYGEGDDTHAVFAPGLASSRFDAAAFANQLGGKIFVAGYRDDYGRVENDQDWYAQQIGQVLDATKPSVLIKHSFAAVDSTRIRHNTNHAPAGEVWLNPALVKPALIICGGIDDEVFEPGQPLEGMEEWRLGLNYLDVYLSQLCRQMDRNTYYAFLKAHFLAYMRTNEKLEIRAIQNRVNGRLEKDHTAAINAVEAETILETQLLVVTGEHDIWNNAEHTWAPKTEHRHLETGHYSMTEQPAEVAGIITDWESRTGVFVDETRLSEPADRKTEAVQS